MEIEYKVIREMLRRGYSQRTIKTYLYFILKFFRKCRKDPVTVTKVDVREYLNNVIKRSKKEPSGNTINVNLNALKFFFEQVLNRRMRLNIKYSKVPKRLPVVLTKDEIKRLIEVIGNQKHKLMIKLMYSAGLRVSELVNLKSEDLEIENNFGWVRKGKGNKDRIFIIAESIKDELKEYAEKNKTINWLFPGNKNNHISQRTIAAIIREAAKKAKIRKNVHTHTLRHSFATHLIENNYAVTDVQNLLGHNSPETTMIYLHTASKNMIKVKSPLDSL
ncbi:tyrosine-type recombinase/integrase [Candidatus Woesearchaeota archaeon]|nr:tyrosine-type recombinase/integrase [Candidatus Woesearchaeota archaeon]